MDRGLASSILRMALLIRSVTSGIDMGMVRAVKLGRSSRLAPTADCSAKQCPVLTKSMPTRRYTITQVLISTSLRTGAGPSCTDAAYHPARRCADRQGCHGLSPLDRAGWSSVSFFCRVCWLSGRVHGEFCEVS
eukprot:3917221-Rhodomonas_salina.2